MSLRTRIAAAAGVAVAIVVVIAAGWRSTSACAPELRGEVDNSLRDRAARAAAGGDRGGRPDEPDGRPPPDPARRRLPDPSRTQPPRRPGGVRPVRAPGGDGRSAPAARDALPWRSQQARWPVAARGSAGRTRPCRDAPSRADPRRSAPAARSRWRGRSTRSTAQLDRVLLCSRSWARPASRSRPPSARVVARTALAPIDRFTRRTEEIAGDPDPSQRIDVDGDDELGAARPQLQRHARRARALGRGAAPARGRREPRAAHADRQPARQHPDARGRRAAARRTSAQRCAPTSSPSSTS